LSKLFRPPYGRITRAQITRLKKDYQIVMWDVLTYDYDERLRPHKIVRGAARAVRSGSIVVFHDSVKAGGNLLRALPDFMEYCLGHTYNFKAL
jgi:peptidoglycan/xylan/chitin deacetylase (PgdA/CDA1 family)